MTIHYSPVRSVSYKKITLKAHGGNITYTQAGVVCFVGQKVVFLKFRSS